MDCSAGGVVVAYVQLSSPKQAASDVRAELQQHCGQHLQPQAIPSEVVALDAMPLSSGGKVQRSALPQPDWLLSSHLGAESLKASKDRPISASACKSVADAGTSEQPGQPHRDSHTSSTASTRMQRGGSVGEGWELKVMRVFMSTLQDPGLEPTHDVFTRGCDSLTAADMAQQLGVDARLIHAFPAARSLARQLSSSSRGSAAPTQPSMDSASAENHASPAKPPATGPAQRAAAAAPEQALTEPAGSHEAGRTGAHPVDPAQGGWVLMPGGRSMWCSPPTQGATGSSPGGGPDRPFKRARTLPAVNTPMPAMALAARRNADRQQPPVSVSEASKGFPHMAANHVWRTGMQDCIDAAPIVLWQPHNAAGNSAVDPAVHASLLADGEQHQGIPPDPSGTLHHGSCYAFACSHGGEVMCVEVATGNAVWRTMLGDRADAGMAMFGDLQVGSPRIRDHVI